MSKLLEKWSCFGLESREIRTLYVFGDDGENMIVVLLNDDVFAIGKNQEGCLGTGGTNEVTKPVRIENLCGQRIRCFHGIGDSTFAISARGDVHAWGKNKHGHLGLGTTEFTMVPTKISGLLEGKFVLQVVSSGRHTLALTSEGEIYAFGANGKGSLGLGTTSDSPHSLPQKVGGLVEGKIIVSVACHYGASIALTDLGEVFAWGDNFEEWLGFSSSLRIQNSPCKVLGLEDVVVSRIVCKNFFILALSVHGDVFAWGGEVIDKNAITLAKRPTRISSEMAKVRDIATTSYPNHPCVAITEENQVYVWYSSDADIILTSHTSLEELFADASPPISLQALKPLQLKQNEGDNTDSVIACLRQSFDDPETADFVFVVEGKKIHVHKMLLTIRCPVFKALFLGDWKDSSNSEQTVDEHSYNTFFLFLMYFYTDEADFTPEQALGVFAAAHFYQMAGLMSKCEEIMKSNLTVNNVAAVYEKAILFGAVELRDICSNFCMQNMDSVLKSFELRHEKEKIFLDAFRCAAKPRKTV